MTNPTPSDELEMLAQAVRRLSPCWTNPERYFEQRSEVVGALMRLSRSLAHRPAVRIPMAPPAPLRVASVRLAPRVVLAPAVSTPRSTAPRPVATIPRRVVPRRRRHRYPLPPQSPAQARLL